MEQEEDNIHLLVEERDRLQDERDEYKREVAELEAALESATEQRDAYADKANTLEGQVNDAIDILGGRRR